MFFARILARLFPNHISSSIKSSVSQCLLIPMVVQSKYIVLSLSAVAAAAATAVAYMSWRKNRRREYHVVGHVSGLFIYPVKSCRGIPLESTRCLKQGLQHDR